MQFLSSLQSMGDIECEACRGCKVCFAKGEEHCPLKDDRDALIEKMMVSGDQPQAAFATTAPGIKRKRRRILLPALRYVQVVKRRTRRRLAGVTQRVVYGTWESVKETLHAMGQRVNTSFIERVNRTLRARVAALA